MAQAWVMGLGRGWSTRIGYSPHAKLISTEPQLVDFSDGKVRQFMSGTRNRSVVIPAQSVNLTKSGDLTTATTASGLIYLATQDITVYRVVATVGTAPVGSNIILDVHRILAGGNATDAGTTIFTTQANRPTIEDGSNQTSQVDPAGVPDVMKISAGDILRVEIDQVGSGTDGSDLTVQILAY